MQILEAVNNPTFSLICIILHIIWIIPEYCSVGP